MKITVSTFYQVVLGHVTKINHRIKLNRKRGLKIYAHKTVAVPLCAVSDFMSQYAVVTCAVNILKAEYVI